MRFKLVLNFLVIKSGKTKLRNFVVNILNLSI